jgi:uncharacterized membrane protein
MTSGSSSQREAIIAGALLGLASGILSWSGFSTLVALRSPKALPKWARSRWTKRVTIPGAAGEVLANAFVSSLPPRTAPPALFGRVVMGAASGALASYGTGSVKTGAIAGGLSAPVGAWVATNGRARLAKSVPDILVAVAETVVAFGLSSAGARRGAGKR